MFFDPMYFVFMLPGLLFMLWAQSKVKGNYAKYSKVRVQNGMTGAQAARALLDNNGLYNVPVEAVPGELTDHYDPRKRVLRLSQGVFNVPSVAAVGIAAHEAGHAIQHAKAYAPLQVRTAIVPAVGIGSNVGFGILFLGFIMQSFNLALIGIGLFALTTVFALITLPVEFDASRRAKESLRNMGLVDVGEGQGVAKVLDAAAWTYIAGFAASLLTLLYYVSLLTGMRRDD
ncbi:MAG: zinc metallopeptidase [Chloroflexota bacterium]|nr:zinc metallopeptidase [Chloroflexota bacterium]MDP9472102.1 zinc metallopeptidase [Chloroflexota bacterium]